MLMSILVFSLAVVVGAEAVVIVWLAKTMKRNVNIQAGVTAELLEQAAETYKSASQEMLREYVTVLNRSNMQTETIRNLEASVEVLNTEIERLEEINRLEQDFKNG